MSFIPGKLYLYIGDSKYIQKDTPYKYEAKLNKAIGWFRNTKSGKPARIMYENVKPMEPKSNKEAVSLSLYREGETDG